MLSLEPVVSPRINSLTPALSPAPTAPRLLKSLTFNCPLETCAPVVNAALVMPTLFGAEPVNGNSDPEDIDKLFDCIQVISLKYELSQRKKVYEDWQRQKPVEYKDVLILKKEWEVKQ